MNHLSTTDVTSINVTNSLRQIDEHFDSDCEEEEDDDDLVLKFSSDESDSEASTHSNLTRTSNGSAENYDNRAPVQKNVESTSSLAYDNNIIHNIANARWKSVKKKAVNNQRSVLEYFTRDHKSDEKVDEFTKELNLSVVVNLQNLIHQLISSRVILERLPESYLVKNHDGNEEIPCKTKLYCPTCDRKIAKTKRSFNNCRDCNSLLKYECAKCGIQYTNYDSLKFHHKVKCFSQDVYRCTQCEYSNVLKYLVKKHMRIVHVESNGEMKKSITCSICKEKFLYHWELVRHNQACKLIYPEIAGKTKFERKQLSKEADYMAFIGTDTIKKTVKRYCLNCDKNLESMSRSENCPDCKQQSRFYYCGACGKCYNSLMRLLIHLKKNAQCVNNRRRFKFEYEKSEGEEFSCAHCPFKFKDRRTLVKHLSDYHGDEAAENGRKRKLKISSCELSDEHARKKRRIDASVTLQLIRALCPKCSDETEVLRPMRKAYCTNSNCKSLLQYECSVCGKRYNSFSGVIYHIESVCQPRMNFTCNECDFTSNHVRKINRHVKKRHSDALNFACDNCEKIFKTENVMKKHRYYCRIEPTKCEMCDYRTKYNHLLKKHLRLFHSIEK